MFGVCIGGKRGQSFEVFIAVRLDRHNRDIVKGFHRQAAALPEVREVHQIAGNFELLIHVRVADLKDYEKFHTDKF